jgi:hypothetical protein
MSLGEPSRGVRVHGVAQERDGARPSKISTTKQLNQEKASRASLYVWSWRVVVCSDR